MTVSIPTPEQPAAYLRKFVGNTISAVDELDGVIVFTLRPVGRTSRRYVALAGAMTAYEVREGSKVLQRIAAAKFSRLPVDGKTA